MGDDTLIPENRNSHQLPAMHFATSSFLFLVVMPFVALVVLGPRLRGTQSSERKASFTEGTGASEHWSLQDS